MFKIPKTLKVGGHQYKIVYPYFFTERYDLRGQHDAAVKEIRISMVDGGGIERVTSDIIVTLIHEVLHGIDQMCGHEVFKDNEPALEGISEGIFQVLVDNGYLEAGKTGGENE